MVGLEEIEERCGKDMTNIVVSIGAPKNHARKKNWQDRLTAYFIASFDPEITHRTMIQLEKDRNYTYFRLNDPGALELVFDDWEPRHRSWHKKDEVGKESIRLTEVKFEVWASRLNVVEYFKTTAEKLVKNRRARSNYDSRWEAYATGALYSCPGPGACRGQEFSERDELRNHLRRFHDRADDHSDDEEQLERSLQRRKIKEWKYKLPTLPEDQI